MAKEDLPGLLCSFSTGLLRVEAQHEPGYFDLVHSHYWLSGQVGALAQDRWRVPLVHSMHTMAKVKNDLLADGDIPEPSARVVGESQVVAVADRLVANTEAEASQLIDLYDASPERVAVVSPGVDLDVFTPGDQRSLVAHPRRSRDAPACCSSSDGSNPSRRQTCCCMPWLGCCSRLRACAKISSWRSSVVRAEAGWRIPSTSTSWPVRSAFETSFDSLHRRDKKNSRTGIERLTSPWCRRTTSHSDWSRSSRKLAERRSSRRLLVDFELPLPISVSGLLVDGHNPVDYASALTRMLHDSRRTTPHGPRCADARTPIRLGADRRGTLDVYAEAIESLRATAGTVAS